jgi:hypothetical protein
MSAPVAILTVLSRIIRPRPGKQEHWLCEIRKARFYNNTFSAVRDFGRTVRVSY